MAAVNNETMEETTVGRLTLSVKKSSNGTFYILVSQPVKGKSYIKRCCWFVEDWRAIRDTIPQVQQIVDEKREDTVQVSVGKQRSVTFKVGKNFVLVTLATVKKADGTVSSFSTWMTSKDWQCLQSKQSEVDAMLKIEPTEPGRQLPRQLKRKRGDGEVEQYPVRSRGSDSRINFYGWSISGIDATGANTILAESQEHYLSENECEEALHSAQIHCDGEIENAEVIEDSVKVGNDMTNMKLMYLWLLNKAIVQTRDRIGCSACDDNQPGQQAHMESSGCLSDWSDIVSRYLQLAIDETSVDSMVELYVEFLKFAKEKVMCNIYVIAQCCKFYMSVTALMDDLMFYCDGGVYSPTAWGAIFKHCEATLSTKDN